MLSDLCDTVATLIAFRSLPSRSRWLVLASSAGAVVAGLVVAAGVDEAAIAPPPRRNERGDTSHRVEMTPRPDATPPSVPEAPRAARRLVAMRGR